MPLAYCGHGFSTRPKRGAGFTGLGREREQRPRRPLSGRVESARGNHTAGFFFEPLHRSREQAVEDNTQSPTSQWSLVL